MDNGTVTRILDQISSILEDENPSQANIDRAVALCQRLLDEAPDHERLPAVLGHKALLHAVQPRDWRGWWALAQAARTAGDLELVDRASAMVMRYQPEFWFARELPKHARGYYAQSGQDQFIERFFEERPTAAKVFVEVGAFDGVHYSNVRRLHERHGWTGLSIEPVAKNFAKLRKSYENSDVNCIQAAVSNWEGTTEINVSTYPHLRDWGSDVATFSDGEKTRWARYGAVWEKETVTVKKLTTLLDQHSVGNFDLLSVDAEGHDLEVLESLDFDRFKPRLIVVEYGKNRQGILTFLAGKGYSLLLDNEQDLFFADLQPVANGSTPGGRELKTRNYSGDSTREPYLEIQQDVENNLHRLVDKPAADIERIVIVGGYLGFEVERFLQNYPRAQVHVFEANPEHFRGLHGRFGSNQRVFCHHFAVADQPGQLEFHETNLEGCGSILSLNPGGAAHGNSGPDPAKQYGIHQTNRLTVEAVTLDTFAPLAGKPIDLLWCDVQGAELRVLHGARQTLSRCRALFLETWASVTLYRDQCRLIDLERFLAGSGFYLAGIGLDHQLGNGSGNSLWLRAARPIHDAHRENQVKLHHVADKLNPHLLEINYLPSTGDITRAELPAEALLQAPRFDIMAKYIYARHRELKTDSDWPKALYAEHLRIMNGLREEDGSGKAGVEAFMETFDGLLDSIKAQGFDRELSLIPVDRDRTAIDGAHRIAAALLYRKPVSVLSFDLQANDYGYRFFRERGLSEEYLDAMAYEYCKLKPNTFIVTLFPAACGGEDDVRRILSTHGRIVHEKQVQLKNLGHVHLVRHMYAGEPWLGGWANSFAGARYKASQCFRQNGPVRVFLLETDQVENTKLAKEQIRSLYGIENHSVHINDSHEETVRLAQLLFNANSIHYMNNAGITHFPRFHTLLEHYRNLLQTHGVDLECFCIDGSSVMAAYGVRDARDIDYLHFGYDNVRFSDPELIGSHNSEVHHHVTARDDIIFNPRNHFYCEGLKFASLGILQALKETRGEGKDAADLRLIDRAVADPIPAPASARRGRLAKSPDKTKIVGLLPARNEQHQIAQCLRALARFTDAIVYLDDASTDRTVEVVESLAEECRVERIIRKSEWHRDEPGDRNALLNAGREIGGTHFIVIDADEMFTANLQEGEVLRRFIQQLQPGDRLAFNWIQLWRSVDRYRFDRSVWTWNYKDFVFCDDGECSYSSQFIHTPPGAAEPERTPLRAGRLRCRDAAFPVRELVQPAPQTGLVSLSRASARPT